jgi:hypothetical protein
MENKDRQPTTSRELNERQGNDLGERETKGTNMAKPGVASALIGFIKPGITSVLMDSERIEKIKQSVEKIKVPEPEVVKKLMTPMEVKMHRDLVDILKSNTSEIIAEIREQNPTQMAKNAIKAIEEQVHAFNKELPEKARGTISVMIGGELMPFTDISVRGGLIVFFSEITSSCFITPASTASILLTVEKGVKKRRAIGFARNEEFEGT